MDTLTYDQVRNTAQDGDIVFIHGSWKNPVQACIMFFTRSVFSHCCIAFWMTTGGQTRLMCVESQGSTKRRILNLSFYEDRKFSIIKAPKPWSEVSATALEKIGEARYDMLEALLVGAREFLLQYLSIKLPDLELPNEICSEFVAKVYQLREQEVSPGMLYNELLP